MLNNDLFSDVKFVTRKFEGKTETRQVIPAHKFVLSIGSPVFQDMFYGATPETRASIELPGIDGEYDSLLELFRYLYSDEVNINASNITKVLYLAKKYVVPSLVDKCIQYLRDVLSSSNVFEILSTAEKLEKKELIDECWEVIDSQSEAAMKSDGFTTIEHSLLEAVVSRDTLTMNEVGLFKAVNLWATKKCEDQGLTANGEEKRRILGDKVVKAIRFPVMKRHEFASVVADAKILTPDEVINFFKFFSSAAAAPKGFLNKKRSGLGKSYKLRKPRS